MVPMWRDDDPDPRLVRTTLARMLVLFSACVVLVLAAGAAGTTGKELRLPADIVLDGAKDSPGPVVFRHATHVEFTDTKCLTCHPQPFSILHPKRRFLHDEMNAGRSCGLCHDGKSATSTTDSDSCATCHAGSRP
jgi:c(7)-type cytochrome triheme protein